MAFQPTPMLSSSTIEVGSELSDRALTGLASDDSITLNISEVRPSEKKEYEETVASQVTPTPDADDYPDGGVAAWCVVLGVSRLNHSFVFSNFLMRVRSCRLCVPISRRRLHSTSLASNNRLTSERSLRFGLASAWGVRAFRSFSSLTLRLTLETGIPILLRTNPHTRDPNLNNVGPQFFTSRVRLILISDR